MGSKPDDLDAVRTLVTTLDPFDKVERERIIRWACEKLGLSTSVLEAQPTTINESKVDKEHTKDTTKQVHKALDIKSFVTEKNPSADTHFAATVAYYYRFEAPEMQRKDSITAEDLQEAARQAGRERFGNPGQTLRNAHKLGLLDKAGDRGVFAINTVGENLVAMTLPSAVNEMLSTRKRPAKKRTQKKTVKATPKHKTLKKKTK